MSLTDLQKASLRQHIHSGDQLVDGTTGDPLDLGGGPPADPSVLGSSAMGGTAENVVQFRWYMKKVSVSGKGWIWAIEVGTDNGGGGNNVGSEPVVAVWQGGTTEPALGVRGRGASTSADGFVFDGVGGPRWFGPPFSPLWVPAAGVYWIGVNFGTDIGANRIYRNSGGSDRIRDAQWISDMTGLTSDSTKDYSLRAWFEASDA